jgi:hypothetical protein
MTTENRDVLVRRAQLLVEEAVVGGAGLSVIKVIMQPKTEGFENSMVWLNMSKSAALAVVVSAASSAARHLGCDPREVLVEAAGVFGTLERQRILKEAEKGGE